MSATYQAGDAYTRAFTITNATGAAANADSTPGGSVVRNGAIDATPTVTITNPATGLYKAAVTIPVGYAVDDVVDILIAATVGGVATKGIIDSVKLVAYDPGDAVRLGLSALPNAAAGANGGLPTGNASGQVTTVTNLDKTGYTASTVSDKTGYALSSAGVQAIWDALTSALTTVGSVGKRIADNLDVVLSTRASASALATVQADTDDLQTRVPAALVGGRIDASVGAMAANVLTATAINAAAITSSKFETDAIDANALKTDAVTEIQTAVAAGSVASVTGAVGSVTAGVTVTTNNDKTGYTASTVSDKTGYSLSAGGVQAIWDTLTSALTTVGSVGKRIADNLDAVLSSRLPTASYTTPPTAAAIQALVAAGPVASVTGAVGSVTAGVTITTNNDKTGYALSAAAIDAILDDPVGDGTITARQALRVLIAGMVGKLSGAATTTVTIRNLSDTADVVIATVTVDGDRTAVTVTP